jgi:hypothetical protein
MTPSVKSLWTAASSSTLGATLLFTASSSNSVIGLTAEGYALSGRDQSLWRGRKGSTNRQPDRLGAYYCSWAAGFDAAGGEITTAGELADAVFTSSYLGASSSGRGPAAAE